MSTEQERAAFEEWYDRQMTPRIAGQGLLAKRLMLDAWQARAALQSQDRRDAARYRWLRNGRNYKHNFLIELGGRTDRSFDAAIDHARRVEGEP